MTTNSPNNQPQSTITKEIETAYYTSAKRLKYALVALEVMLVMFTLPHNLKAFGVSWGISWGALIGILGVAVLEGVFLFGMGHFTHGWIASATQRKMAMITWGSMTVILVANAIASELMVLGYLPAYVEFYRGFILPSTPVISLVLGGLLLSFHPQVIATGRAFQHLATVAKQNQEAEIALLQSKNMIRLQDIDAKKQEYQAELEARQIEAGAKLDKLRADSEHIKVTQTFANDTRRAIFSEKTSQLNNQLNSQEFKQEIGEVVNAEIKRVVTQQKKEALEALGVTNTKK